MKNIQKIGFLSVLLFLISCSTKKDAFLNRNYNALTTQYNILYNNQVFRTPLLESEVNIFERALPLFISFIKI